MTEACDQMNLPCWILVVTDANAAGFTMEWELIEFERV